MFENFGRLGPLVKYDGSVAQATMTYFTSTGSKTVATSVANAEYEAGAAKITLQLRSWETSRSIDGCHVDMTQAPRRKAVGRQNQSYFTPTHCMRIL